MLSGRQRLAVLGLAAAAAALAVTALAPVTVPDGWARPALGGMALVVAAAAALTRRWLLAEQRAARYRRRNRLLSQAALEVQQLHRREEIYQALPRLLVAVLECTHAEVFVPRSDHLELVAIAQLDVPLGYRLPLASVSGRALRQRRMVYVPDLREDREAVPAPDALPSGSEVAIPLHVHGEVVAVVNAEHLAMGGFTAGDRETLEAMGSIAEDTLARIDARGELERQRRESEFFASVVENLLRADDEHTAAAAAVRGVAELIEVQALAVLELRQNHFAPLHVEGRLPDSLQPYAEVGLPHEPGALSDAWHHGKTLFVEDYQQFPQAQETYRRMGARSVAVVPIVDAVGTSRAVLMLAEFERTRRWTSGTRNLLQAVANVLGVALQRLRSQVQLRELLDVVRRLARSDDASELYQRAAEAAVRLVPGADAATILVRERDQFVFAGEYGYDREALEAIGAIGLEKELHWYGLGGEAFARGEPRLVTGDDVGRISAEAAGEPEQVEAWTRAGRIYEIRANIFVPIPIEGEVIGVLNVDSFTRDEAFGSSDLELAEAFAQQVGAIIRQAQTREKLAGSLITDPVTGVGNREGFNQRLSLEMAKARRHQYPVHLVMMDLDGFKRINDLLGHHCGDVALQRVARALEHERRAEDGLFRWGGDEFALVLSGIDRVEARQTAERYARAVSQEDIEGYRLSVSIGIASFPEDGADADDLLRRADDLMYQHKHRGGGALTALDRGDQLRPEASSDEEEVSPDGAEPEPPGPERR